MGTRLSWITLAAIVALVLAACGGGSGGGASSGDSWIDTPEPTQTAEDTLLGLVPESVSHCKTINRPAEWFDGAQASLTCRVSRETVHFHLFADGADLDAAFNESLAGFDEPPAGVAWWDTPYAGSWMRDGEVVGDVQCYHDNGAVIEWTESGSNLYGVLKDRDGDMASAVTAWEDLTGGELADASAEPGAEPEQSREEEEGAGVPAAEFSEYAAIRTWMSDYSSGIAGASTSYVHFKAVSEEDDETVAEVRGSDTYDYDEEAEVVKETDKRRELVDELRAQMEGDGWTEVGTVEGGQWYEYRFGR
jgi:hypothetical protein